MANEKQGKKSSEISGLVFVGCLMIGFAVGFLIGNVAVGLLGGLGVGFIAMAIVMASMRTDPRKGASGLVFVGFLMIGLAIGLFTGNVAAALFGGLGAGFIGMAIARYATGAW